MPDPSSVTGRPWLFATAIALPLALLAGIGTLTHSASENHAQQLELLHRLASLKSLTATLLTTMVDQETGQRGYLLSQNPDFLEPYDRALSILPRERHLLATSITEPASRALLAAAETSIDARLAFAAESVELQRSGDHAGAVALVRSGKGKMLMDRVRADLAALEKRFDEMTRAAEANFAKVLRTNELISWTVVAVDGLFVALLIMVLLRLRRAERFLHVCAWSKTVEYHGEWVSFETYLMRRFGFSISHGISPKEAEKMREMLNVDFADARAARSHD